MYSIEHIINNTVYLKLVKRVDLMLTVHTTNKRGREGIFRGDG